MVETNIYYPTDSSLLGDGVRVLTRTMKKITAIAGAAGAKLRDRSRSVKLRVLDIARAARSKAKPGREKLNRAYGQLLSSTSRVVGQAQRFAQDIAAGIKRAGSLSKQLALEGLRAELERMTPLVRQVMKQTRARVFRGDTRSEGKILSLFEPSHGNHPQRQGQQADRVRQDGETAGSRKPDRHRTMKSMTGGPAIATC